MAGLIKAPKLACFDYTFLAIHKQSVLHLLLALSFFSTHALSAASSPVSYLSYSAVDADQAAEFCKDILGAQELIVASQGLTLEQRWLSIPTATDPIQLRFDTAINASEFQKVYERKILFDRNMTLFTDWMNEHMSIRIADLTGMLERLKNQKEPFLGPFIKDEGLYQVILRIPGAGYLSVESPKKPAPHLGYGSYMESWEELLARSRAMAANEIKKIPAKGAPVGSANGQPFGDPSQLASSDLIKSVYAEWYGFVTMLSVEYQSGRRMTFGNGNINQGQREQFLLEKDELLVAAMVCHGILLKTRAVKAIRFVTSRNQKIEFGTVTEKDSCEWLMVGSEQHILGFHGSAQIQIDRLGVFAAEIPTL